MHQRQLEELRELLQCSKRILLNGFPAGEQVILQHCEDSGLSVKEVSVEEIWAFCKTLTFPCGMRKFILDSISSENRENTCLFVRSLQRFWPATSDSNNNHEVAWTLLFCLMKANFGLVVGCCDRLESVDLNLAKGNFDSFFPALESTTTKAKKELLAPDEFAVPLDKRLFSPVLLQRVVGVAGETLGFTNKLSEYGVDAPRGIILHGPPGTGKTCIAHFLRSEFKCTFFSLKISQILHAEVGKSEKSISAIFEQALANQPAILFFDEIDGLFANEDSEDVESLFGGITSQLCFELDNLQKEDRILLLAATNSLPSVNPSLLINGRFDCEFEVQNLPSLQFEQYLREELVKSSLSSKTKQLLLQDTQSIVQKHNSPAAIVHYLKFITLSDSK